MKKFIKRFLKIFGIFLLLLIAILIAIPFLFKGKILNIAKTQINKNINAKANFKDLNLSVFKSFPDLRVQLDSLSVVGIENFENDTLVAFKSFAADLNILSLMGDEIKINAVILDHPKISGKVLKDGEANWDIAKDSATTKKDSTPSEPTKFKIALKKLEIIEARISYDDQKMRVWANLENFNFKLKGDLSQDNTNLDILLKIASLSVKNAGISYLTKTKLEFLAKIDADLKNKIFVFKDNKFSVNEIHLGFNGKVEIPDTTNKVFDLTFEAKKTDFRDVLSLIPAIFLKDFQGLQTAGKFAFNGFLKGTLNAKNIPAFGLTLNVENAMFKYPALPKSAEKINISVKIEGKGGDGKNNIVDVSKFHVELGGNPVDANLHVETSAADVALKGKIDGKLDLATMKDIIPLENMEMTGLISTNLNFDGKLSDIEKKQFELFKADGKVEVTNYLLKGKDIPQTVNISQMLLFFTPQFVKLENLDVKMGASDFQLKGNVDNILGYVFKNQTLAGNFAFTSQMLNLNEFLSKEKSQETKKDTSTSTLQAPEVPTNLDFKLSSNLKKVIFDKIEISEILGLIEIKDGKLSLNNLKMNLLKGSMLMSGSYNSKNISKPEVNFALNIENFDIPETFKTFNTVQKLAPVAKNCAGNISLGITFETFLDSHLSPLFETFNGKGNLRSRDIKLTDSKFFNLLAENTKMSQFKNPSLQNLNMFFVIKNGNIEIEPTKIKIANIETEFSGTQRLDQTVNYQAKTNVPKELASKILNNLPLNLPKKDVEITILIGGTVTEPKVTSIKSSLTDDVKDVVKDKIDEEKEKLKKKAKAEADKIRAEGKAKADKIVAEAKVKAQQAEDLARKEADNILQKANQEADKLVNKAPNAFAKEAAKVAAKKVKDEARKKADQIIQSAANKAQDGVREAQRQADNVNQEAERRAKDVENKY